MEKRKSACQCCVEYKTVVWLYFAPALRYFRLPQILYYPISIFPCSPRTSPVVACPPPSLSALCRSHPPKQKLPSSLQIDNLTLLTQPANIHTLCTRPRRHRRRFIILAVAVTFFFFLFLHIVRLLLHNLGIPANDSVNMSD